MAKESKRYKEAAKLVDLEKGYALPEAVELMQKMPAPKFDETVELSGRLGVDPKQSEQMVRGTINLPNGSGKKVRVLVFTEDAESALKAGAEHAGLQDMIKKVEDGWLDFDIVLATPTAMKEARKVARTLGPRGLMPNPKSGTVAEVEKIPAVIDAVKKGRVEFKMDKTGNVSIIVGKRSFSSEQLVENVKEAVSVLGKARPDAFKGGRFVKSLSLSATMSPSLRLEEELFAKL
tara:strand:+ start:126172 stop:126873 length:702 start_codon:yes stop_codon:yes gene_type:complete